MRLQVDHQDGVPEPVQESGARHHAPAVAPQPVDKQHPRAPRASRDQPAVDVSACTTGKGDGLGGKVGGQGAD